MKIIQINDRESEKMWDAYVGPRTTSVTDLAAWRHIAADAYGMASTFLGAVDGDQLVGGLGLFEAKHQLFGHYLSTAAFSNDGGFYYNSEPVGAALLEEAKSLADQRDVDYLLIRTRDEALNGFRSHQHYCTAVIDLSPGKDIVWKKTLPAKTRNQVRRGIKEGFTVESGPEQVDSFYEVFQESMRDLGSPAHSRSYYDAIIKYLGKQGEFIVVRDGQQLAAGALVFRINNSATNYHTVALKKFNRRCPNYLIYWKMIEDSCERGCTQFDMGRSVVDSTQLAFKKNWGPETIPLYYNYYLRKLKEIPYVDPRNPRYRIPIAIWRRLPLAVTKRLGPELIKGLL